MQHGAQTVAEQSHWGWINDGNSLKSDQTFQSSVLYLKFIYQTSSDVLDGLLDVHA